MKIVSQFPNHFDFSQFIFLNETFLFVWFAANAVTVIYELYVIRFQDQHSTSTLYCVRNKCIEVCMYWYWSIKWWLLILETVIYSNFPNCIYSMWKPFFSWRRIILTHRIVQNNGDEFREERTSKRGNRSFVCLCPCICVIRFDISIIRQL